MLELEDSHLSNNFMWMQTHEDKYIIAVLNNTWGTGLNTLYAFLFNFHNSDIK